MNLFDLVYFLFEMPNQIGWLKHFIAATYFLQGIGFVALFGVVIYEFFSIFSQNGDDDKKAKADRQSGESPLIVPDNLPKLKPINCQNCGAGVPLREGEMICPNCGTVSKAPENYFDVARIRTEINDKLRDAAVYLKRADRFASNWVRAAIGLTVVWLTFSLIMFFVFFFETNFETYKDWFTANSTIKNLTKFGLLTWLFWVISLGFGFLSWSPRLRKALPTIEFNEKVGKNELTECVQCGGTVLYQPNDLVAVCGYCGIEIYRATIAWKLKNLTNRADEKANFSLLEAKKYVADAIDGITGTPKVLIFLLILVAIIFGGIWLFSAIYNLLPNSVKEFFGFIEDIFNSF